MPAKFPDRLFSDEEKKLIRAFYPWTDTHCLTKLFNGKYTLQQISRKAMAMKLRKSHTAGAPTRSPRVDNLKPRSGKNKRTAGYQSIRLSRLHRFYRRGKLVKYATAAQYAYYKHYGRWPAEHEAIRFRDGDPGNISPQNLILSTKREVMQSNHLTNFPPEIKELIKIKGLITRSIKKRSKHDTTQK